MISRLFLTLVLLGGLAAGSLQAWSALRVERAASEAAAHLMEVKRKLVDIRTALLLSAELPAGLPERGRLYLGTAESMEGKANEVRRLLREAEAALGRLTEAEKKAAVRKLGGVSPGALLPHAEALVQAVREIGVIGSRLIREGTGWGRS